MSEFKVGDRVITKWDDSVLFYIPHKSLVDEGEHVIVQIWEEYARLDHEGGFWYPLSLMSKVDDAPAAKDDCRLVVKWRG